MTHVLVMKVNTNIHVAVRSALYYNRVSALECPECIDKEPSLVANCAPEV